MTFQVAASGPYLYLPSGILIVEPREALLTAHPMLLVAEDYSVAVSESVRLRPTTEQ